MSYFKGLIGFILWVFLTGILPAQQGDGLYLLSREGLELAIIEGDQVVNRKSLPFEINSLHPTPGGGYLFLLGDGGQYIALNSQSGELEKTGRFPMDDVHWLTFSPRGHQLYLGGNEGVMLLEHSKGAVINPRETEIAGDGAITFNRRGTRYYLTINGSMEFRLVKNNSLIELIRRTDDVFRWVPDPRFTSLWGINGSGKLIIVDESRGRVLKNLKGGYLRDALVFHGSRAYLLAGGGRDWISLDQRRFKKELHWKAPEKLSAIHKGKTHWYFPAAGSAKLWIWRGEKPGKETLSAIEPGFVVRDSIWLSLKQGEGFACF